MNTETIWKIAGLIVAALASVTGILGALYGIVTVPTLRTLKAEISASESRLKTEIISVKSEITAVKSDLEKQMIEMEARLNQRIDTRLVHH